MGNFIWPEWMPLPQDAPPPSPPPDPMVAREEKVANDTRVEQGPNRFLGAKQGALFDAPDAFYRAKGEDAIHAAPVVTKSLDQLRTNLLDGLGNDYQRQRLGTVLDAQMQLTRDGMARHVAEQSLAWQRGIAQDRIALLAKEAAQHHNDTDLVDALGHAAATAARAHSRVGDGPPGGQAEDAAAATARSGVLGAAIQARLDQGDTAGANALFTQVQDQLDPAHAAPLQGQIDTVQRLAAAKEYARQLVPAWSDASHEEADAQHAAATQQNQTDNAGDPEFQTDVQHVLDVQHGLRRHGLDQAAVPQPNQAVQEWLSQTGPGGEPQIERPPAALWNTLDLEERAAVDRQLSTNAHGEAADGGWHYVLVPLPGSIAARPRQPPTEQPPDQAPNPPQEGGPNDSDPGRRLPEDEPPPGSPEDEVPPREGEWSPGEAPPRKGGISASTIAIPEIGAPTPGAAANAAAKELGRVIARLALNAGRASSARRPAATVRLAPGDTQATTTRLGDRLRTRSVPGQRGAVPDVGNVTKPTTQNPGIVSVQFNSERPVPKAAPISPNSVSIGRRGTAPPTEPPSNSAELERDFEQMQGRLVRLPDGSLVPNAYSDSGYLMSPFSDLSDVAAAGRNVPARVKELMGYDLPHLLTYFRSVVRDAVGQGGTWDYQRRHYAFGKGGFTQLRQFRDVANFNVGLYCQQAGIPLFMVLDEAGKYAAKNSKNAAPDQPDGLDPRTREQIVLGYKIGESGVFNRPERR